MTGQTQQGRGANRMERLGEMSFINHQQCSGRRQLRRQTSPAHQLQLQIQHIGLPPPVRVQTNRCHDHEPQGRAVHQSPSREQSGERLAQAHFVGQNSTTTGQQPPGSRALMRQRHPSIHQRLIQIRRSHQLPMGWQRWQRAVTPVQPLLQRRCHGEATTEALTQRNGCRQRKLPPVLGADPTTAGADATQLCLRDGIKRTHHLDQTRRREVKIAARRSGRGNRRSPQTFTLKELR